MSERTLFITGASGFIGRHLQRRLSGKGAPRLVCLSRNVSASPTRNATWVSGELRDPSTWAKSLEGVDAVVHLAAATGAAAPEVYQRANVEGTRALVEAAEQAGVERFCLVSTIAAGYPDIRAYPYARSKLEAELIVQRSSLKWGIVRPTIVLGARSPVWRGIAGLAKLPLIPAFGRGRARVQPIHVADVANALATWFDSQELDGKLHDLGGPEELSFGELLQRVRQQLTGSRGLLLPLPARLLIPPLWWLEGPLRPLLPLTAGQLHAFAYDSNAEPNPLLERISGELRDLATMIEDSAGPGGEQRG